jgi:hypothetical protein
MAKFYSSNYCGRSVIQKIEASSEESDFKEYWQFKEEYCWQLQCWQRL